MAEVKLEVSLDTRDARILAPILDEAVEAGEVTEEQATELLIGAIRVETKVTEEP